VKDNGRILRRSAAVLTGQEIACDHLDLRMVIRACRRFDSGSVAGGPGKTAQVAKATIQQSCYESGPNETRRSGYEDTIVLPDDVGIVFRLAHIVLLNQLLGTVTHDYVPFCP
jgi:hypothetical protein